MKLLSSSEYGAVRISKQVMDKLVLDELLKYEDVVSPCSQSGRTLKRGFFSFINELIYYIEFKEYDY